MQRSRLEVLLHPGDEYVGSLEPESLQVLTYMKLADATVDTSTSCIPWSSPSGSYPVLRNGPKTVISKPEDIITYLKEQGFNTDNHLKDYQQAETMAYAAFLRDRLQPAILYTRWLDNQNYLDVTRKWYGQMLHFPLSIFIPSRRHGTVQHTLMTGVPEDCTHEQRGVELLSRAEECISLLSARLGEGDYFFGNRPSTVDALVFGYLEVVLQCPLPSNNILYCQLYSAVNLVRFCERIRRRCFPDMKLRSTPLVTSPTDKPSITVLWKDPTLWVSVGLAVLLLGLQGYRVGLIDRLSAWILHRDKQQEETLAQ